MDYLRNRPDVDPTRMLSGGISRGGILAIVHAARRPDVYRGADGHFIIDDAVLWAADADRYVREHQ